MRYIFSVLSLIVGFSYSGDVFASEGKFPSKYAVHQQQGAVCPFLPWVNLQKIRDMRARDGGQIVFQEADYSTKLNSYALFLPRIRTLDTMYDNINNANGSYAAYERTIREQGIKDNQRFSAKGEPIETMDSWFKQLDRARRPSYSPFNFQMVNPYAISKRWLPIIKGQGTDELFFYDFNSHKTFQISEKAAENNSNDVDVTLYCFVEGEMKAKLFSFESWMLSAMGVSKQELESSFSMAAPGLPESRYILNYSDSSKNGEIFYDVGTFQHMLFACGVKADNTSFVEGDDSLEVKAYGEFRSGLNVNPLNPWHLINKEDLFEYHLAQVFKNNPELKAKAKQSVGFYNDCWRFYEESFNLYDSATEAKTQFSQKQRFLPGEDQMLAYLFSGQLRFLWSASISMDALVDVEELNDNLGDGVVKAMKMFGSLPGVPSVKQIISASEDKKYGARNNKYSFMDTWSEIKPLFLHMVGPKQDFVSFSSHGSVISFDDNLIEKQSHESRPTAQKLGFEMWDSHYDKGLNPFYRKSGREDDMLKF